jgi:glycosyltransferase involved in cell wall biosynthesis
MLRGVPVLAAEIGGLPEAKLGVPYLLPVRPAEPRDGGFRVPEQDVEPWAAALAELLAEPALEAAVARASRAAALDFVAEATPERFAALLDEL